MVAMDTYTGEVHAVGSEAKRMIGRTPASISAIRPLRHGVIADFEVTEQMLRYFIRKVHQSRFAHPRLVMCAPSGVTDVEKRAVIEASLSAGARRVHLIEEPIAAAIGAGLEIDEPVGNMVVDVGGGTTEVAVISLGGHRGGRVDPHGRLRARRGDRQLHQARARPGDRPADRRGHQALGRQRLPDPGHEGVTEVRGRDLVSGLPKTVTLTAEEVRGALAPALEEIVDAVKDTLERTPPELASDIAERGILLAGGGALLQGFDQRVREETGMPTNLADSPLTCVVVGSGALARGVRDDLPQRERRRAAHGRPSAGRPRAFVARRPRQRDWCPRPRSRCPSPAPACAGRRCSSRGSGRR